MSLPTSEAISGLFETPVTLEDVNAVISEQLNTEARLKETSKLTVVGDGNGFLSRVILVEPEWTISDARLEIPERFILKITTNLHMQKMVSKGKEDGSRPMTEEKEKEMWNHFLEVIRKMNDQEVCFYRFVSKREDKLRADLLMPKMFFGKTMDQERRGFVGLEYVEDCVVRHVFDNTAPEELHPVLKAIAALQATTFLINEDEKRVLSEEKPLAAMGGMMSEEGIKGLFLQTRKIGESVSEKVDIVVALGKGLVDLEFVRNLNTAVGIEKDVLVHGDLWSTNILWKQSGDGHSVNKILDYQLIHFGNPAEDLVRLFVSTLSGTDRRDHWESLTERFYDYFVESLNGQEPPYTLEQLKESYRLFFVAGALALLPMFGPVVEVKMKSFSEEEKEIYQKIVCKKAECLLEDVVTWHEYRVQRTKKQ